MVPANDMAAGQPGVTPWDRAHPDVKRALQAPQLPPTYLDKEQQLLAFLLQGKAAFGAVVDLVEPEHFADPVHAALFSAICVSVRSGGSQERFIHSPKLTKLLAEVGGAAYVEQLATMPLPPPVPGRYPSAARDTAEVIRDVWYRRQVYFAAERLFQLALNTKDVPFDPEVPGEMAWHDLHIFAREAVGHEPPRVIPCD